MAGTALLMIDMQNSYLADDGVREALGWPPIWRLDESVAACSELLAAARAQEDAVAPQPGEIVLDKASHSLFDFTGIDPLLRNLGVSRLIVAGLQTNVCVEATARGGLAHGFEVAVPEDAVSTDGPDLHYAALNSMRVLYVEIARPGGNCLNPAPRGTRRSPLPTTAAAPATGPRPRPLRMLNDLARGGRRL